MPRVIINTYTLHNNTSLLVFLNILFTVIRGYLLSVVIASMINEIVYITYDE